MVGDLPQAACVACCHFEWQRDKNKQVTLAASMYHFLEKPRWKSIEVLLTLYPSTLLLFKGP